ncbi:MAG: hypothetical protein R3C12_11410 [Planctomycetaceae bacterium]
MINSSWPEDCSRACDATALAQHGIHQQHFRRLIAIFQGYGLQHIDFGGGQPQFFGDQFQQGRLLYSGAIRPGTA